MRELSPHRPSERFYTTTEAARLCGLSSSTLFRAIQNKQIKAFATPGGHFRVTRRDLEEFAKKNGIPLSDIQTGRKRVLVVGHMTAGTSEIQRPLDKNPGWEIKAVNSAVEAGLLLSSLKPDLVILYGLGEMERQGLLRIVRSHAVLRHMRVLPLNENDPAVSRPIDPQALTRQVEALLAN